MHTHIDMYIYVEYLFYELAFDDDNSCLIRQLNGVFVLGLPLPPPPCASSPGDTFFMREDTVCPPGETQSPCGSLSSS